MNCGVGRRRSLDPVLLWLWHRPVAAAPIRPLAWEPPYAAEAALEMAKRQKKKKMIWNVLPFVCSADDQLSAEPGQPRRLHSLSGPGLPGPGAPVSWTEADGAWVQGPWGASAGQSGV